MPFPPFFKWWWVGGGGGCGGGGGHKNYPVTKIIALISGTVMDH